MTRKIVNVNDPGTSVIVGSDDFDYINRLLTGEDQSATDPVEIGTSIQFRHEFRLNRTFTMAEITNDVNNYGFGSDANNIRLTSDADRTIHGFTLGTAGRIVIVHNVGLFTITFKNESTSATITNRFSFGSGDFELAPNQSCIFEYDSVSGRWRSTTPIISEVGEINTASNAGTGGIGIVLPKSGVDLPFKSIAAGSTKVTVSDDAINNNVDIDVNEANLTLGNIGGTIGDSKIATHTSTKISITNKSQLNSAILYNDVDNDLGNHFLEIGEIAAPANPAANKHRLYVDSGDDHLKRKDSAGTVKDYDTTVSFPISIAQGGTGQTTKTNAFDALSPTTTDGDITIRSGGDNIALSIGSEGQVLTVVSGLPAWAAAAGGGGSGSVEIVDKTTTHNTIANTTTETSLYSVSIPANYLSNHGVIRVSVGAEHFNNSASAVDLEVIIKYGTTTLYKDIMSAIGVDGSARVFKLNFDLIPDNNSASAQYLNGLAVLSDATNPVTGNGSMGDDEIQTKTSISGTGAETTTTIKTLDIRIRHTTADANISITRKFGMTEYIA